MSTKLLSKSHAATWTLLVIAIPVLYLLTLPWVKCVVIRPQLSGPPGTTVIKGGHEWMSTRPWPPWLDAYCVPYHWLMEQTSAGWMLSDYQEWCFMLGQ
ncbi:hypothetical protein [Roseimicrobium sp. ORNL1]|uniref:hypothetical protein n=1 Tax=Roseimicrobium sp. ORNL1 TaxID=2711231 RepID=UPI0013E1B540|nr:hypothetical protein [Roseimicrobium sp. ORNL1]QIF03696.1 hypothetical protein G5S37_19950 [Roseimicrobium sp. ORNL1]